MRSTISHPTHAPRPGARPQPRVRVARRSPLHCHGTSRQAGRRDRVTRGERTLARYRDWRGRPREVVTLAGAGKSVLVLDRDRLTRLDPRLLVHLAPDEPAENALLVSRCFVARAERTRCPCRRFSASDLRAVPFSEDTPALARPALAAQAEPGLYDAEGRSYELAAVEGVASLPQLRWCRRPHGACEGPPQQVSVRETVAALERYEPVLTLTRQALAAGKQKGTISTATIRAELARMLESPIVLNRALRAAAVEAIERRGLSMSEIAMRCGRVKHDSAGHASGETSWLARRLGLLPEGGRRTPTPWVHSDVLALIARDGLGLAPREVEAD